jgi:hypothetical protein
VLEKLAAIQLIDVCIPTTDGRWLILPRYTQPDTDTKMLLHKLQNRSTGSTATAHYQPVGCCARARVGSLDNHPITPGEW